MQEKDYNPIERMRHRDTDDDGIVDYVDSNGYSKPNDGFRYKEVSPEEHRRLQDAGLAIDSSPSKTSPGNYIVRFTEHQAADVENLLSTTLCQKMSK